MQPGFAVGVALPRMSGVSLALLAAPAMGLTAGVGKLFGAVV